MSLITVTDFPDVRYFQIYESVFDLEKRAAVKMTGLLQATSSGYLLVGVPTALARGIYDAMDEPGISFPAAVDGGALRAGIVVMTPEELESLGGASSITERGKQFPYQLGGLEEAPATNWPGVSVCWHLRIYSPELGKLRRSYGLPTKVEGDNDFSIVVACRKTGVLTSNPVSKAAEVSSARPELVQSEESILHEG
jgi:hypothetical protein